MAGGYEAFEDPYLYPGSSVLKNLLDIRDASLLESFEVEISHARAEEGLPEGRFDAAHYRSVHHHLFQDVYGWAGQYRTVRIAKGETMFCYPENIALQVNQLFDGIGGGSVFSNRLNETFLRRLASFLAELNAIHPFREGNGRTQLAFVGMMADTFGQPLHLERVRESTLLPAMIASFAGDLEPLTEVLRALRE